MILTFNLILTAPPGLIAGVALCSPLSESKPKSGLLCVVRLATLVRLSELDQIARLSESAGISSTTWMSESNSDVRIESCMSESKKMSESKTIVRITGFHPVVFGCCPNHFWKSELIVGLRSNPHHLVQQAAVSTVPLPSTLVRRLTRHPSLRQPTPPAHSSRAQHGP